MSESGTSDNNTDTFELLREEARDVIERQLTTISQTEDKASSVLRINLLVFGALLTVVSIIVRLGNSSPLTTITDSIFTTIYVFLGIAALILSSIAAGITYTASNTYIGVSGEDLNQLTNLESYSETKETLVAGYSLWVKMNQYTLSTNHLGITLTISLIVTGVIFLGIATLSWLLSDAIGQTILGIVGIVAVLLVGWLSGLPSVIQNYLDSRSMAKETTENYYEMFEQGGTDQVLEGSQRGNQQSKLRTMARKGRDLMDWIAENPSHIVGEDESVESVQKEPSLSSTGGVSYRPDVIFKYPNGRKAIVEAKLSDNPSTLRSGIQQLLTYKEYVDDPDLFLVAEGFPESIQAELDEHGINGVVYPRKEEP